ncbi:MAG: transcriptional regulator [Pirellulales bacterium]|nr:transcriptional regulator [Pirellulales bacterium]
MTSTQRRFAVDQIEELPKDLLELGTLINELPLALRQQLESSYTRVVESTRRRRRILTLVQEALGQLRLDMKYLTFDLDAPRNERDALLDAQDEMED